MNQTSTVTHPVETRTTTPIKTEPSNLAKAITAFTFSDLTVRPCGHGLPPTLPFRQDDWTLTEIFKSDLRRYSITDRAILWRLEVLDHARIPYDHIYVGHQDKEPFKIPPKVIDAASNVLPALASITLGILTIVGAVAAFTAQAAMVVIADPVVVVAIKEKDNSYQLLEIAKWYD
jgi:hypothetical protein